MGASCVVAVLLVARVLFPPEAVDRRAYDGAAGMVVAIAAGDRLVVEVGGETVTVRLLGVDANGRDDCREMTQGLVGGAVTLVLVDAPTRDASGVLLAYVYAAEGLVNERLIAAGVAFSDRRCGHPYDLTFRRTEEQAAARRAGLWATLEEGDPPMPAWRARWLAEERKPAWERGEWRLAGEL